MTEYTHILRRAWQRLVYDFEKGSFTPQQEADIQCYLYHLCLQLLRDPSKIHAEWREKNGGFVDLMLGPERLAVEIKWSYVRRRKNPSAGWVRDIEKLSKQFSRRKPAFVLFLSDTGCRPVGKDEAFRMKKSLEKIEKFAKRHEVNLLIPFGMLN